MATTLDPEVKSLAKKLHCVILGWGAEIVTILYHDEAEKLQTKNAVRRKNFWAIVA
jgi:hypothetical protein